MIDEQAILAAERLRDSLIDFRKLLHQRISKASQQVASDEHRKRGAAQLAEIWLVELSTNHTVGVAIGSETVADLTVHFQRILTFSEHATIRSRYDTEFRSILNNYSVKVVLPLKQSRGERHQYSTITLSGKDPCSFGIRWTILLFERQASYFVRF